MADLNLMVLFCVHSISFDRISNTIGWHTAVYLLTMIWTKKYKCHWFTVQLFYNLAYLSLFLPVSFLKNDSLTATFPLRPFQVGASVNRWWINWRDRCISWVLCQGFSLFLKDTTFRFYSYAPDIFFKTWQFFFCPWLVQFPHILKDSLHTMAGDPKFVANCAKIQFYAWSLVRLN